MKRIIFIVAMLLAGCVQIPPTPQDIQAKRFDVVPDKAVIYVVRPSIDSLNSGTISLGNSGIISTQQGTYYRWEVAPGTHHIQASGPYTAAVTVRAEAGKIYFVQHTVRGDVRHGVTSMALQQVGDAYGRRLVEQAQLL
jgi:hypothetical protein